MRLATIQFNHIEQAAIVTAQGVVTIETVNKVKGTSWHTQMYDMICEEEIPQITQWYNTGGNVELESMDHIPFESVHYGPLYRNPQRIFGIGLNYKDHTSDLGEGAPVGSPVFFNKPASCMAGRV